MLGTLKAGCAYVPIDLASPASRAARIVSTADVSLVSSIRPPAPSWTASSPRAASSPEPAAATTADVPVEGDTFRTSFDAGSIATLPDAAPAVDVGPGDAAHILFTSGSTGLPKGVLITHDNVAAFLDWALPVFGLGADDRLSSHPPLHFDLSTFDVYGSLTAGAELRIVDPALNLNPHGLARFIGEAELTQWFSVPSTMTFLASADAVPEGGWPTLRRVLFCGEVLPTPVLRHWMKRLPHAVSRTSTGRRRRRSRAATTRSREPPADDTEPIPIGVPCDGEELLVLDEALGPVATGEIGDLYIGGVGLSPGYWRDEEKTNAAFVRDPADPERRLYRTGDLARLGDDGLLYFLGRVDSQIKSRGYRIELGEIETALNALDTSGSRPSSAARATGSRARRSAAPTRSRRTRARRLSTSASSSSRRCPGTCSRPGGSSSTTAEERERQDRPATPARAALRDGGRDEHGERLRVTAPSSTAWASSSGQSSTWSRRRPTRT